MVCRQLNSVTTIPVEVVTWRDLEVLLTPRQVERLARVERRLAMLPADQCADALLAGARAHGEGNLARGMVDVSELDGTV